MRFALILYALNFLSINNMCAQANWSSWQELYSDANITVSIKFRLTNSCESNQNNLFSYKLSGDINNSLEYLSWKSDIINCNGQLFFYERSIKLADFSETEILESMDFSFEAREVVDPFYDIALSNTETFSSGVKAMPESVKADYIIGDTAICKGSNTTLFVEGGSLGIKAKWMWYSGSCNGKYLGSGESVNVSPDVKTRYYVKAVGEMNETACVQHTISVHNYSIPPDEIISSINTAVCEGEIISLALKGGKLIDNAQWKWHEDDCSVNLYKSGTSIDYKASRTILVSVRAEGVCISNKCISKLIEVNSVSKAPSTISKPATNERYQKITLKASGGWLGKQANYEWYKGSCGQGKVIGIDPSIVVKAKKDDTYFLRIKGLCNVTKCVEARIITEKLHMFNKIYSISKRKFLHLGVGIGVEYIHQTATADYIFIGNNNIQNTDNYTLITYNGFGLKGDVTFHPIIKQVFSLGFTGSYTYGITPFLFPDSTLKENETLDKSRNQFSTIDVGTELSFGFRPIKFLLLLNGSIQENNIEFSVEQSEEKSTYILNNTINKISVGGGLRLGRYSRIRHSDPKRANAFDILYTFSKHYSSSSFVNVQNDILKFTSWTPGVGFSWWRQSAFKLQFKAIWNELDLPSKDLHTNKTYPFYQASFIYCRNWFY